MRITTHQLLRRQSGFTMVEAMVALVVLAVGMLGIAGLYVTTLRSGGGAIYRFQAVNLASDLADRIRANRTANVAYLGPAADNNCYGAGAVDCAPALMAANDLLVWQNQVAAMLPAGNGVVNVVAGAVATDPYTYTITITWVGSGDTAASAPSYVLTLQI
jgi:type IV pilus assembly protein PilV